MHAPLQDRCKVGRNALLHSVAAASSEAVVPCWVAACECAGHAHRGLEEVPAAEDRLHSGQSMGKIVVQLAADVPAGAQAASKL